MASRTQTAARPQRRLLNLHEVATALAVSVDSVDRFIRAGQIPVVRLPSGRRRVDGMELDRVIERWKGESL